MYAPFSGRIIIDRRLYRALPRASFTMKILKAAGFFLLALVTFLAFTFPFFAVPQRFENKVRAMTLERIENGSLAVDESYIEQSIGESMRENVKPIFRTAFLVAAAAALIVFCLAVRPPHDAGGFNLFNPIALVFVALVSLAACFVMGLALNASAHPSAVGLKAFLSDAAGDFSFPVYKLLLILMVPAVLEAVFRGAVFSFLEKVHPIAAVILTPLLYAFSVYYIVGSYTRISMGTTEPALAAGLMALGLGFVETVFTWRLNSVIPAILSHVMIAACAPSLAGVMDSGTPLLVLSVILLVSLLAGFVVVFTFLSKKRCVFAYDFPFEKHHEKMKALLSTPAKEKAANEKPAKAKKEKPAKKEKKKAEKPAKETEAVVPAEQEKADNKTEK